MSDSARRFMARAPRYTLRPGDNQFLRFAHQHDTGHSYTTRFIDISMTGLAFIVDSDHAPRLSELIKVEIPLTDTETIAWWARVVRTEEHRAEHREKYGAVPGADENQVLVCIAFHELPAAHSHLIRTRLNEKFDEVHKAKLRNKMQNFTLLFVGQFWQLFLYALCVLATVYFFYFFSKPDANYGEKGAPWGQRFPSLNIFGSPESN